MPPLTPEVLAVLEQRGSVVIVLLAGGDKRTQTQDIKQALELAKNL